MLTPETRIWLTETLGVAPSREELFVIALTHPSASQRYALERQRLEWLGDAALLLAVSEMLADKFPTSAESDLSNRRSALVGTAALADLGRRLRVADHLRVGMAEIKDGNRVLADTVESLLGAALRQGGVPAVQQIVARHIAPLANDMQGGSTKAALQAWCRQQGMRLPLYLTEPTGDPAHTVFHCMLTISGEIWGAGIGSRKVEAEERAAGVALAALQGGREEG